MIYEDMSLEQIIDYINTELLKGRTMKDIEENDFNVNERVIAKRLARKNVKKINGQFVLQDGYKKPEVVKKHVTEPAVEKIGSSNSIDLMQNQEFLYLIKKVDMLEKAFKEMMRIQDSSKEVTKDIGLKIYYSEDKPIAKTIRLYKEVWDKIDKVKEIFPHLSYQTVLNSLIDEITEKYLRSNREDLL
ncbi:hypothetical protein H9660_13860 [Clostridium sp. Sa3CUN1]|uniref:Phage protein n=1 Tax=Clostridium gallinarum TaxID=2762246 RepID=A0ABR8Q725_9CLOT|nr:hypothetical protein [Clostridium gallinarum]MBD7916231.1 hypothetical protein [Clostridium gallinarum]